MNHKEKINPNQPKNAKAITLLVVGSLMGIFLIVVVYYYFNPMVISNLGLEYLAAIKPEDRGLEIQNVSGYSNGIMFITFKNEGDHSVVIKDIMLHENKKVGQLKVINSINKEIPQHSSNIVVRVWFSGTLQIGEMYGLEVFTQRGSYIGQMERYSDFVLET